MWILLQTLFAPAADFYLGFILQMVQIWAGATPYQAL